MLWTLLGLFAVYKLIAWALTRICITDYKGKSVLITGCDTGFGNLLAKHLDGLGIGVFAACLTPKGASSLQDACSDRVTTLLLDVTDENSIDSARQFVESRLPAGKGLWGLVNNAGVAGVPVPSEWQTPKDWDQCLSVNLHGVINTTRAFLPLLRRGGGRVVNMSSMMGIYSAAHSTYCVSKYGVEAFSDCLRRELYSQGVKVCIIEPGYFKTNIIDHSALIASFQKSYDNTPEDIRQHYEYFTVDKFARMMQEVRKHASDDVHLVVKAVTLALTSKFPPTRQLVGNDARFFYRPLFALPAPLRDWLMHKVLTRL